MSSAELGELLPVRSWRIMDAEPHGAMMWFDPDREVPSLRSLPHGGEEIEGEASRSAEGLERCGTLREVGGGPLEGGDAKMSDHKTNELPF